MWVSSSFYVGEWRVEPDQNRLVRGSESTRLDAKAIAVLSFLAQHPNDIVTKEQIISAVWDGAFVSDEVLTTAIWGLRKALGDDAKEPRYIKTIPRQGYRLIAPVERGSEESGRAWEPSPYPGLSAFSQRDASFFFGREEEVESLWAKLQERTLLGLIGPSGAGKSSLLRAGLIPACPEGWGVLLCQPRNDPLRAFEGFDTWRAEHSEALVVVDQFEELFTLNDEETQGRFAEHLAQLSQSGVHVLLSMRDDFLIRCHTQPSLALVFKDLTPVLPLEGAALRKALVEPARASGYRFEDEALVAEILTEVSRERGALPLLAFAASKLWEKRDREGRRLTREAYLSIGGVAGALAKHAEEMLSNIGLEQEPIVREIFRNLTTASGTRVPCEREELLTVFEDREKAAGVLSNLVDARLLTSGDQEIEIIHESLLSAWPRMIRWQAQDAEGAVLRDQLRQSARLWEERGRADDLLWTGTAFQELALWRERYAGGLTAAEEAFSRAATRLAGRRRRRRAVAFASLFVAAVMAVAVTSSLWRAAALEVERREAAQILSLGRLLLDDHPTGALAYALASLEKVDTAEARRFAVEVLSRGPTAFVLPENVNDACFSPDGRWLATGGFVSGVRLWSKGGHLEKTLAAPEGLPRVNFEAEGAVLVSSHSNSKAIRFFSVPEGREIRSRVLEGPTRFRALDSRLVTFTAASDETQIVRVWSDPEGEPSAPSTWAIGELPNKSFDASGDWIAYARGKRLYLSKLDNLDASKARLLGEDGASITSIRFHPAGNRVVTADSAGEVRFWPIGDPESEPTRTIRAPMLTEKKDVTLDIDPAGSRLFATGAGGLDRSAVAYVWDLNGPPDADPLALRFGASNDWAQSFAVHPEGSWVLTSHNMSAVLWSFHRPSPVVLRGHSPPLIKIAFTPDGKYLASSSDDGTVRLWPLTPEAGERSRILMEDRTLRFGGHLGMDPTGKNLLALDRFERRVVLVPLNGGKPRLLHALEPGLTGLVPMQGATFSSDGRLAAVADAYARRIRIWDVDSGKELRTLDIGKGGEACGGETLWELAFTRGGDLLSAGSNGVGVWNVNEGTMKSLGPCAVGSWEVLGSSPKGRTVWLSDLDEQTRLSRLFSVDLETGRFSEITSHGNGVVAVALDPTGTIAVTGDRDGVVRVGPVTGEEPHLLFGHRLAVSSVAISPDGHFVASAGEDGTIRLWPMPTGPPLHLLPYEELLRRLRTLTNLRVVADETSGTGYRVEVGPFPGWKEVPMW
jgi:WD40 repeat protein/DNA-binding winged helix-turn-helix (wHTH) protein